METVEVKLEVNVAKSVDTIRFIYWCDQCYFKFIRHYTSEKRLIKYI